MDLEITPELVAAVGDNLIRISRQYDRPLGAGMYYFESDDIACSCPLQLLALDNNLSHGSEIRPFISLVFTAGFDGVKFEQLDEGSSKWWWEFGNMVYEYLNSKILIQLSFSCARRPLEERSAYTSYILGEEKEEQ